ncbi:hypothetical protein CYMTET_56243 [Cymbomonas tetramitiformis]|uniref:Large ribosomal subunit protein uL29c n=1 Tax=Cymbomonas tetramitiformis TaxID=36881 RepID=A0AAE0BCK5_9CHLO|nr:hypothetical protein CYMTET_56243 [Cymbomonas tetramitiformis]
MNSAMISQVSLSSRTVTGNSARLSQVRAPCASRTALTITASGKSGGKASEYRSLDNDAIEKEIATAKRALFDLRMKRGTRQEFNSSEFRDNRKKVAKMNTILREREIAEGVSKRDSRKMAKVKQMSAVL